MTTSGVSLGQAYAEIGLDYSKLEAGIATSKTLIGGLGIGLATAAVGVAVATTKMAGQFQSQMDYLQTNAGELSSNMGTVSNGILDLAVKTGTSTTDLAAGMFMVESANYRGAAAIKVETAAAEGSKVAHADLSKVTDVLTTSLHDYHMQADMAVPVMNSLIAAVGAGKMSMDDLNAALTNVLPVASKAGIGISDVEAALAAMAQSGDRGAGAGTHLSQMFSSLQNPAAKGQAVLKEIGLTTQEVADKMKVSLPGAIEMMYDALAKKFPVGSAAFNAAAAALVGGNKQMKAWNELTGSSFADLTGSAKITADALHAGGDSVQGWAKVQGEFNTKVDQAREVVETLGIKIGTALLPVATTLFNTVTPLVSSFDDWITKSGVLNQITSDLSTGISDISGFVSTLTGNVNSCGTTFGQANPLLYDAQTVIGNIKDILPDVGQFLSDVGTDVNTNLLPPLESLVTNVANTVTNFTNWADTSGAAQTALQDLSGIVGTTTAVVGDLIGAVSTVVGWLGGGGAGTDTLVVVLSAVATAFVGLKIADTVASLTNMWNSWSQGAGVIANVADAVKGKLSGAIGDFLSSQAPSLKATFDDMKVKATDAATAEAEVGTTAEGSMAEGVATGVGASEASMGELATAAEASSTAVGGIGVAGLAAAGTLAGVGAGLALLALQLSVATPILTGQADPTGGGKIQNYQGPKSMDTLQVVQSNNARIAAAYANLQNSVTGTVKEMDGTIVRDMDESGVKAYTNVKSFASNTMSMLATMGDYGTSQMQTMDQNMVGYWNDVAGYISSHPIDAAINIDMTKGSTYSNVSAGIQKNFYAEGTPSAPPGWSVVGEKGPELMKLHGGETILPHGVMPSSSSGSTSYSGGGGHSGPVNIYMILDSQVIGHATAPHIVQEMRINTGMRN